MQDTHTSTLLVSNHAREAVNNDTEYGLPGVNVGAFFDARIRDQSQVMSLKGEVQLLHMRLDAHSSAVMELFCLLVENAPETLPAEWATVADVIAAEERLWVYPTVTVGQIEDGCVDVFTPYLNRKRLAAEWSRLLEHARRVHECQESGRAHDYDS